ncbi:tetratricopeptide repeat protein [Leptospira inadai serovar Lyme str. 10]|uniref:Tetratricopeptide repeat protein n=2 Tax=Leptospira inadai serovar Lyme TaxID=293084 RepID=V6HAA7_9LEPT|nr:tetratricopeptide repeat protein [Leptospira inadai]EQA36291.1 tetratricopeptide repeat protein [Leptospira inadai serovar Lyme str. 10]PNV74538.1 anaphase-promoting protein [Leptospira inadai serovar Lyme]
MDPRLRTALDQLKQGDSNGAKEVLQAWILSNPSDPQAYFHFGMCLSQLGDLSLAEEQLQKCLQLEPGHVQAWVGLGVLYARRKDKPKAEFHLSKALELDDTDIFARKNLAAVYTGASKFDRALELLKGLPDEALDDSPTLYALAICYVRTNRFSQARETFRKLETVGIPDQVKKEYLQLKQLLEEKQFEQGGIWSFLKTQEDENT